MMNDHEVFSSTENEVKFFIANSHDLEEKLLTFGASLKHPRVMELNLRFDTPDGKLTRNHQVLRLRKDQLVRLTFKGPLDPSANIAQRLEYEITVSDFLQTRNILESLGYTLEIIYEKYRKTYEFQGAEIVLDDLPFGTFCEIEGASEEHIRQIAEMLGLDWQLRIIESYISIFKRVCEKYDLKMNDLTFAGFPAITIAWEELDIHRAN